MSESPRVHVLPDHVINKIAAGEVVERPASALKELLENAIDAGATRIEVAAVDGGRKLVSVADDGCGMPRQDALLAIERHATSKIHDVDDIEHIATLGFRGEALAAIAAVSRFRLQTCPTGSAVGTEIVIGGGRIQDVRDAGCPQGTTIDVRDLFFNVPARRKFLRSPQTELAHVRATFTMLALANPVVGLQLRVDNEVVHNLPPGGDVGARIADLFGAPYVRNLVPVQCEALGMRLEGYAGLPAASRADRSEQYVFINGRCTSAPVISHAIRAGYHTLVPHDRHPVVFLFVTMPPDLVDVNVHPTKREVRFRRPFEVRDLVVEALKRALATPGTDFVAPGATPPTAATPAEQVPLLAIDHLPHTRAFVFQGLNRDVGPSAPGTPAPPPRPVPPDATPAAPSAPADTAPWAWCRVLGQVGGLYVVLETGDGLVLMDPHAAHERVLFERFMREVLAHTVNAQRLLFPETVELPPRDAARVRDQIDLLRELGFGIEVFGRDVFKVDAMPSHFTYAGAAVVIREIAGMLEEAGSRTGNARWREEAIAQAACKAAVKSRDRLTLEEIERLVIDLAACEMPYTCPHGRPTLILNTFGELHRRFGRA